MRTISKLALIAAAALALTGLAARLFQTEIGLLLADRAAAARVGRDATAGLPDGLHVAICGSGSLLPDRARAGPCTLVIAGRQLFLVDAGEGGARNLALMGIPLARLTGVFITHFHSDHIDGLGPLMLLRWTASASRTPLPVRGPPGIERVVAGFNAAYALDNGYRVAHHGAAIVPPTGAGAAAFPFAVPKGGPSPTNALVLDSAGLKVTAFRVDHDPVTPAVGYRFDYKGRSVVISGDTAPSPSLVAAARGADLLVHEALQPRLVALLTNALAAKGQARTARITRDILDYHTTPEQVAAAARAAGVRTLLLNHLVPPLPNALLHPAFLGQAADHFGGPITIAEDGMMLSLAVGSTEITTKRLL